MNRETSEPDGRPVAIFRRMLILYPSAFRREYEGKLILLFRDQLRDARTRRTKGALFAFWIRMLVDTGCSAGQEHLGGLRRALSAESPAAWVLHVLPSSRRTFVLVLLLGIVGSVARWSIARVEYEAVTRMVLADASPESFQRTVHQLGDKTTFERVVRSLRPDLPVEMMRSEVSQLGNRTTVMLIPNTTLVEVRYAAFSPTDAAAMANRIADAFLVRRLQEIGRQDFAIIDRAVPPLRARTPTLPQALIQGVILGAIAGGACALILDVGRRSTRRTNAA